MLLYRLENSMCCFNRFLLIFLFITYPCFITGQELSNIWQTGYNSHTTNHLWGGTTVDFYSSYPDTSRKFRYMNLMHTNASISDSLGHLLLYTNGLYIANANDDTLLNGVDLSPSVYATSHAFSGDGFYIPQGAIILPKPGSNHLYYLIHEAL